MARPWLNAQFSGSEVQRTQVEYTVGEYESGFVLPTGLALKESPSSVSADYWDGDSWESLTEVTDKDAVLGATEFRVNYDADQTLGGAWQFGADDETKVRLTYKEIHSLVWADDLESFVVDETEDAAATVVLGGRVTGDSFDRVQILTDSIKLGDGTAAPQATIKYAGGAVALTGANLGLGTTDVEAWDSDFAAVEWGGGSILGKNAAGAEIYWSSGAYYDGDDWNYKSAEKASQYYQFKGTHRFRVAVTGTADAAVSWIDAMSIDNAGNVGIGVTDPDAQLQVAKNGRFQNVSLGRSGGDYSEIGHNIGFTGSTGGYTYHSADFAASIKFGAFGSVEFFTAPFAAAGTALTLTKRMRLDVSGHLMPGADGTQNLGDSTLRWATIYAETGTINTSARRRKDADWDAPLQPGRGMAAIRNLKIYEGAYKSDPAHRRIFPAWDETPEWLRPCDDGESWIVDNVTYANSLAIQDLDRRLAAFEADHSALTN